VIKESFMQLRFTEVFGCACCGRPQSGTCWAYAIGAFKECKFIDTACRIRTRSRSSTQLVAAYTAEAKVSNLKMLPSSVRLLATESRLSRLPIGAISTFTLTREALTT
jgi:hypothetical protein